MSVFDKVSMVVGKIVIYLVSFFSCFYMADLLCTALKPYFDEFIDWVLRNYAVCIIFVFVVVVVIGSIIWVFSDKTKKDDPFSYYYSEELRTIRDRDKKRAKRKD